MKKLFKKLLNWLFGRKNTTVKPPVVNPPVVNNPDVNNHDDEFKEIIKREHAPITLGIHISNENLKGKHLIISDKLDVVFSNGEQETIYINNYFKDRIIKQWDKPEGVELVQIYSYDSPVIEIISDSNNVIYEGSVFHALTGEYPHYFCDYR